MTKNKNRLILCLMEAVIIIVLFSVFTPFNHTTLNTNPFSIGIITTILLLIAFLNTYDKKNKKIKMAKRICYILIMVSEVAVLIYEIINIIGSFDSVDVVNSIGISNILIIIGFYLSVYVYIRLIETENIKIKTIDYLPIIINLCFLILLIIIFCINKKNLTVGDNIQVTTVINYGIYAYSFAGYFMIAHIMSNIYLLTLFSKKKLNKK